MKKEKEKKLVFINNFLCLSKEFKTNRDKLVDNKSWVVFI